MRKRFPQDLYRLFIRLFIFIWSRKLGFDRLEGFIPFPTALSLFTMSSGYLRIWYLTRRPNPFPNISCIESCDLEFTSQNKRISIEIFVKLTETTRLYFSKAYERWIPYPSSNHFPLLKRIKKRKTFFLFFFIYPELKKKSLRKCWVVLHCYTHTIILCVREYFYTKLSLWLMLKVEQWEALSSSRLLNYTLVKALSNILRVSEEKKRGDCENA